MLMAAVVYDVKMRVVENLREDLFAVMRDQVNLHPQVAQPRDEALVIAFHPRGFAQNRTRQMKNDMGQAVRQASAFRTCIDHVDHPLIAA